MRLKLFLLGLSCFYSVVSWGISFNEMFLPDKFIVYTNGYGATQNPNGGTKVMLPTDNKSGAIPGCYIACYSTDGDAGVYKISNDIYVIGQIRVPGNYTQRTCIPSGMAHQDISTNLGFKQLCAKVYAACDGNRCWAGGDTGGWLGIIQK